jgi:membrane protein implicated in regulation of membrane protease activity
MKNVWPRIQQSFMMSGQSPGIGHIIVFHFFCWLFALISVCFVSVVLALLTDSFLNSKLKRNEPNLLADNETTLACRALVPSPSAC